MRVRIDESRGDQRLSEVDPIAGRPYGGGTHVAEDALADGDRPWQGAAVRLRQEEAATAGDQE